MSDAKRNTFKFQSKCNKSIIFLYHTPADMHGPQNYYWIFIGSSPFASTPLVRLYLT